MATEGIIANEKGAAAYSGEGASERLNEMGVRGGSLVVLNTEILGPRCHSPKSGMNDRRQATGGTSRERLESMIDKAIEEGESHGDEALREQCIDLCVLGMEVGAVREGRGERTLFVWYFLKMYDMWPRTCLELLPHIPEYASWKLVNQLYEQIHIDQEVNAVDRSDLREAILRLYTDQLQKDWNALNTGTSSESGSQGKKGGQHISLAGKWAPTLRSMYDKTCGLGKSLCCQLFPAQGNQGNAAYRRWAEQQYRKMLSTLRSNLDVTERKMAGKRWAEIEPMHVASVCNKKNRYAFQNLNLPKKRMLRGGNVVRCPDDPDRIKCAEHYEAAIKASLEDKSKKRIKGSANQPHELVAQYLNNPGSSQDDLLEAMWLDLKKKLTEKGNLKPGIPLVDVSGSMFGLPMEVSIALGILMAQLLPGPWHGQMITFESQPQMCSIANCRSLKEAVNKTESLPVGGSTNLSAALDLVLEKAVESGVSPENLPETMFVFTDMEWDEADEAGHRTLGEDIRRRFRAAGYNDPPHIILWNLRASGTPTYQVDAGERGFSEMSGFSQQILKDFLEEGVLESGEEVSPVETLYYRLNKECFQPLRNICSRHFKPITA